MTRISIDALFNADDSLNEQTRSLVMSARIVVVTDVMSEDSQVVYGRQILHDTISSGNPDVPSVLEVELDMEGGELNRLCGLLKAIKGDCDNLPAPH